MPAPLATLVRRAAPDPGAVTDADLLDRFVRLADQAAFELLIWRHGAMVWGACRRILFPDRAAAEDACQAAFAALVAHAGRIRDRDALAAWLHRVAVRAALDLRAARRAVPIVPEELADPPAREPDPARRAGDREVRALLDAGLNRLPDKLRVPFVLCELEGRSNAEAAAALGCPVGTVESRLTRARKRLRDWLTARGVVPAVAALGAGALPESARAAMLRASNPTALSATVREAAARAVPALLSAKMRAAVAAGFVLVACAVGFGVTGADEPKPTKPPTSADVKKPDAEPTPNDRAGDAALPTGAVARFGSPRLRHGSQVFDVCFSPDGKRIASVGMDATLRVWDAGTGEQLFVVRRTDGDFGRVSFAPGGKVVAVGHSPNLHADMWWVDAATGKVLNHKALDGVKIRKGDPAVRFSRDGSRLAIGDGFAKRLVVIDTATADEAWAVKLGDEVPDGVAVAWDGKTVAVATSAGKIRLFDADGKPAEVLDTKGAGLTNVALSPDGSVVVAEGSFYSNYTGFGRGMARPVAWTRATGKVLWHGGARAGYSLTYSPDGKRLVCSAYGIRASTLDATNGKVSAGFDGQYKGTCSAFSPDSAVVAFGTLGGTIVLYDPVNGKMVTPSADPPEEIQSLRFSPDGKTLTAYSCDFFAWDVATGKQTQLTHIDWNGGGPLLWDEKLTAQLVWNSEAVSLTGPRPAGSDNDGSRFVISEARTGATLYTHPGKPFHVLSRGSAFNAFTPDGKAIVAALADGTVRAWGVDTGKELFNLPGPGAGSHYRAFSTDCRVMAVGAYNADAQFPVRVYDLTAGKELAKFHPGPGVLVTGVAVSGDGRRVTAITSANARGREDPREEAVVWDVASGKVLVRVPQKREVRFVDLSPDGRLIALAASWDGEIRVHEVASGAVRFTFRHEGPPMGLVFAPDGRTLAVASLEAPIILWDVAGALAPKPPAWGTTTADQVWDDLTSRDAVKAFATIRLLRANPEKAVALLSERTKLPALPANLKELLADLGAMDFATREKATAALAELGAAARPALVAEAGRTTDPEVRKRLGELLKRLDAMTPARVRLVRAVEALEGIGTREAKDLLERWAGGSDGAPLAAEAKAALLRRTER